MIAQLGELLTTAESPGPSVQCSKRDWHCLRRGAGGVPPEPAAGPDEPQPASFQWCVCVCVCVCDLPVRFGFFLGFFSRPH